MTGDPPRLVGRRTVYEGWNTFDVVTVEVSDAHGTLRRHEREVIDHGEAACVLTVDRRRGVAILVRQWRGPLVATGADPYLLEACAGIVDPGETPDEAARREAHEETGLEVGELRKIGTILTSTGTLTERMHLYVAEVTAEDRRTNGGGNAHEGEDIEVVEMPLEELFERTMRGEIEDAKTVVLVQRLMLDERERR